jgi:hypothetical protein
LNLRWDLLAQLGSATATAENLRRNSEQAHGEAERSSSQNAQLLNESRDQEKLLAEARDEAARINQLRANDEASLFAAATKQNTKTRTTRRLLIPCALRGPLRCPGFLPRVFLAKSAQR